MGLLTKWNLKKEKPEGEVKKVEPETVLYDEPMHINEDGKSSISLLHRIVLDHRVRLLTVVVLVALVVPVIVYVEVFGGVLIPEQSVQTCTLKPEYRVPCLPGIDSITQERCESVGCCFNTSTSECHHTLPASYAFETVDWSSPESSLDRVVTSSLSLKPLKETSPLGLATRPLQFAMSAMSDSHLRMQLVDAGVQIPARPNSTALEDTQFDVTVYGPQFSFDVHRRSPEQNTSGEIMLTTARGPMISSADYWEITFGLPQSAVFGLGDAIPEATKDSPKTLYSSGARPGSHPFVMALDENGDALGLFVNNMGAMEIELYDLSHLMVLRSVAPLDLEIHLFAGPTPADVMDQFTAVVGRPAVPPYWALGYHVCPEINDTLDASTEFQAFIDNAKASDMPWDSHCVDHNVLGLALGTTDKPLEKINFGQSELDDRRILLSLPAAVASGADLGAEDFLLTDANVTLQGEYRAQDVVFPDYWDARAADWLQGHLPGLVAAIPVDKMGGFVLADNWPSNDAWNRGAETLAYLPQALNWSLSEDTVWWRASHTSGSSHHLLHNAYGLQHSRSVRASLGAHHQLLLSASTFPGSGAVGGCHVQQQVHVPFTWRAMRDALSSALGLGLAGIPLAGGPVCGTSELFDEAADQELCLRWHLLAAALPLMRAASAFPHRDAAQLTLQAQRNVREALRLRYTLLPYLHTLFVQAHRGGAPVARPMFFDYPRDPYTWQLDTQYMLGPALLAAPVLRPDAVRLYVYFPVDNATWYLLQDGSPMSNGTGGYNRNIPVVPSQQLLLVKSGSIVPMHEAKESALSSRRGNHSLLVALQCDDDDDDAQSCWARGEAQLGDPLPEPPVLEAVADQTSLTISNLGAALAACATTPSTLDALQVFGLYRPIEGAVAVDVLPDRPGHAALAPTYDADTGALSLSGVALDWCESGLQVESIVLTW